jgi:hypothetical protein
MPTALLAALLALLSGDPPPCAGRGPAATLDRIAAVVGDDILLESETSRIARLGYLPRRPGEEDTAYRNRVLDELIVDLLRDQEIRRMGVLEPDPAEVKEALRRLADQVEKERGVAFDAVLAEIGSSRQEVTAVIQRGLSLSTYVREWLEPSLQISEADVAAFYAGDFRALAREKGVTELPPLAAAADQVRELLKQRRINEKIADWTSGLREKTRVVVYRR